MRARFLWIPLLSSACDPATVDEQRGGQGARFIELARGYEAGPLLELARRWEQTNGGDPPGTRILPFAGGVRLERAIEPGAWRSDPSAAGAFVTERARGAFSFAARWSATLELDGEELHATERAGQGRARLELEPDRIRIVPRSGARPTTRARFRQELWNGFVQEGRWSVRLGDSMSAGIPVWSGERVALHLDLPPRSRLTFRAAREARDGQNELVVLLDGQPLLERAFAPGAGEAWCEIPLPPAGRQAAELAFEWRGAAGLGALLQPLVGPDAVGTYGRRPWPEERRDVVLLVADTFRADNLAAWGGDPALAPHLNDLAAHSRCFLRARASSSWTLPALSTLLTGLLPPQHGANGAGQRLAPEVETLAQRFAAAGYRSGAVSDGVFFTPTFGLERGFASFFLHDPHAWSLRSTLEDARAFLAQDDGRPVFLVVHTMRTHGPYRTGTDESHAAWQRLCRGARAEYELSETPPIGQRLELFLQLEDELRQLYQRGVQGLDEELGPFLRELSEAHFLERGFLAFTGDHGEALGENQDMFHDGALWESKLSVPLLLCGGGLAPGLEPDTASLVDLAPTLLELSGVGLDPRRGEHSLLARGNRRAAFAFLLHRTQQLAILDGTHKLLVSPEHLDRNACDLAYDIAVDPHEEHDLAGQAAWPAELLRQQAPILRALLAQQPAARTPSAADQQALQELGYGADR